MVVTDNPVRAIIIQSQYFDIILYHKKIVSVIAANLWRVTDKGMEQLGKGRMGKNIWFGKKLKRLDKLT